MAKILSIKKIKNEYSLSENTKRRLKKYVYDIEVEDNHNFLANDILVSNSSASTYLDLNKDKWENIYYKLGLTATMMRSDGSEMQMEGVLDEIIFKKDAKEAINEGYLTTPHFFIDHFYHKSCNLKQWQKLYKKCIVNNVKRNELIARRANKCAEKGYSVLILVKEIEQGENLLELIPNSHFIHGNTDDRENLIEDFRNGKIKVVIGTSIFGEGSDIPIIDVLINAQAMKAEGDLIQKIGRVLRLYKGKKKALIFDIFDENNRILNNQAKQRFEVYKEHYTNNIKINRRKK